MTEEQQRQVDDIKAAYMSWKIGNHSAVMRLTHVLGDADEAWDILMGWEADDEG